MNPHRRALAVVLACFGASGLLAAPTSAQGAEWTAQNSGTTNELHGVSCPSASTCFAVGVSGKIVGTINGGSTWTAQNSGTTESLNGVSCPTASTCFAVGSGGKIVGTINGGSTWTAKNSGTTEWLDAVSCPTALTCFAVGGYGGTIVGTTNGGSTWTAQNSGTNRKIDAVSCPTASTCFATAGWSITGQYGHPILRTTNGGSFWGGLGPVSSDSDWDFNGISCPTTSTCFAVGNAGNVIRTINGSTFTAQDSGGPSRLYAVSCPTTSKCFAVGVNDIRATINSGEIWTPQKRGGNSSNLYGVSCPDVSTCFAVGDDGTIVARSGAEDIIPPETTIVSGPTDGEVRQFGNSVTFGYTSNEPGSIFQCSMDGAAFSDCTDSTSTSFNTYTGLSVGQHTFRVRAIDPTGNIDPTPATRTFTIVDTTAPETTITSGPSEGGVWTSKTVTFTFSSSQSGSTFQCRMDGSSWGSCASPKSYSSLSLGNSHTFEVRAIDPSGNIDPTPASRSFIYAGVL